jgi:hypothetical protein
MEETISKPNGKHKNNINLDFNKVEYEGVDWVHLARGKNSVAGLF